MYKYKNIIEKVIDGLGCGHFIEQKILTTLTWIRQKTKEVEEPMYKPSRPILCMNKYYVHILTI